MHFEFANNGSLNAFNHICVYIILFHQTFNCTNSRIITAAGSVTVDRHHKTSKRMYLNIIMLVMMMIKVKEDYIFIELISI